MRRIVNWLKYAPAGEPWNRVEVAGLVALGVLMVALWAAVVVKAALA